MSRKMSVALGVVVSTVVFALVIGSIGVRYRSLTPHNVFQEIWLPEKYTLENLVKGSYLPSEGVEPSGTVFYVPFKEYQEAFADKESSISVTRYGIAYYIVKGEKVSYVATKYYLKGPSIASMMLAKMYTMRNDGAIGIHYYKNQSLMKGLFYGLVVSWIIVILFIIGIGEATIKKKTQAPSEA